MYSIIGSGIAGLACSYTLSNFDINNEIFESSDSGSENGYGIQLSPNASNILEKLGILEKLEAKMKESQENIKKIRVEGMSGSNSVKVVLDGEGEMQNIEISDSILKEDKSILEDLIVAAHNDAKTKLKTKTSEELSKATGGFGIPGFKWPL